MQPVKVLMPLIMAKQLLTNKFNFFNGVMIMKKFILFASHTFRLAIFFIGSGFIINTVVAGIYDPIACIKTQPDHWDISSAEQAQKVSVKNDIDFLNQAAELRDDVEFYFGDAARKARVKLGEDLLKDIDQEIDGFYFLRVDIYIGKITNLLKYTQGSDSILEYQSIKLRETQNRLEILKYWLLKIYPERNYSKEGYYLSRAILAFDYCKTKFWLENGVDLKNSYNLNYSLKSSPDGMLELAIKRFKSGDLTYNIFSKNHDEVRRAANTLLSPEEQAMADLLKTYGINLTIFHTGLQNN